MDESERAATLKRLQEDHLRGALGAEEYARLREQVMTGQTPVEAQQPAYWPPPGHSAASLPPPPPAGYGLAPGRE